MPEPDNPSSLPPKFFEWLGHIVGRDVAPSHLTWVAGDASPRRYLRLNSLPKSVGASSLIAVISPPSEKNEAFLSVGELLAGAEVRVPAVVAADAALGFFLLEDFGDSVLLDALSEGGDAKWYPKALAAIGKMAVIHPPKARLPLYDDRLLTQEMMLFPEWFLRRLMNFSEREIADAPLEATFSMLAENALNQPQVCVHRDFHSRNLMCLPDGDLGVIDFQDAVIGPVTYDYVSLLKDCYVVWPRDMQLRWLASALEMLRDRADLDAVSFETFVTWFDLMGLQRHIKVLGIFARLYLRDAKPQYLNDLPVVLQYVSEALSVLREREPQLALFADWFDHAVMPEVRQQAWYRTPQ